MLYLLSFVAFVVLANSYDIKFAAERQFFSNTSVSNPYSNVLRGTGTGDNNKLLICWEDLTAGNAGRHGECEIGNMDTTAQTISFPVAQKQFDALAADNYQIQLQGPDGPLNNFLIGYTNGGDSSEGPGKMMIASYDVTTNMITYGAPVVFNVGLNDQSSIVELERDDGIFVVCYSVGANDQRGTGCRLGSYDVDTLTIKFSGNQYMIPENGPTDGMGIHRVNNETILVCFAQYGGTMIGQGVCSIGKLDNIADNGIDSVITWTHPALFNEFGGTDEIKIRGISRELNEFVICYVSANDGACSVAVVNNADSSSPSLTVFSRNTFTGLDKVDQVTIQTIRPNTTSIANVQPLLVVCFVDLSLIGARENAGCLIGEVNLPASRIDFDLSIPFQTFEPGRADRIDAMYIEDDNMIVCYVDISTPLQNVGPCVFGQITK